MNIKINTSISDEYDDIHINITAPSLDENTQLIIDAITNISKNANQIIGELDNKIYIIPTEKILCFYSDNKYNYCKTIENSYRIHSTLYELEEKLDKNYWIRISKSCITNLNHIKCFDIGTVGSIVVVLDDNTKQDVSKRKVKEIMNLLKKRRGL